MEARDERRLLKLQRELQAVKLLIVDELGCKIACKNDPLSGVTCH